MAVHLQHLNGDSTFLLTFSSLARTTGTPSKDGTFTVLTDPWLASTGAPQIHPKFAFASRKVPAHVDHLSQIPAPDVVVISQAKPDHCHEDTLRQLPADLPRTVILAHPHAAKKIRGWKYFDPSKVHALRSFSETDHTTVVRFSIPARIPNSTPGEATITLIKQPRDMTKLHNAIAITYRPPVMGIASLPGTPTGNSTRNIHTSPSSPDSPPSSNGERAGPHQIRAMLSSPALKQHDAQYQPQMFPVMPLTPPETPPESEQDPTEPKGSAVMNFSLPLRSARQRSRTLSSLATTTTETISTKNHSPSGSISEPSPQLALSPPTPTVAAAPPQPLSWPRMRSTPLTNLPPPGTPPAIPLPPIPNSSPLPQVPFSPQPDANPPSQSIDSITTLSPSALLSNPELSSLSAPASDGRSRSVSELSAYATTHLVHMAALPLTLIMHPFARIDNPWWLGGNISAGVPGALDIVRRLMARNWVSAHDEDKEESGVGLRMMRKGRWNEKQVRGLLGKGLCAVRDLPCGEEMRIVA